jgi:uncharacterized protein YdiU (UPF0061 family)
MWTSTFVDSVPNDPVLDSRPRQVSKSCLSFVEPTKMPSPEILLWNKTLSEHLSFQKDADVWSGNMLLEGMKPFAHCYGGHQFGNWAGQLGDGRAISLGTMSINNKPIEIQLKGSGITPYSRRGDGRAVLRSSLREYLCSEAMYHLNIPTSRALSLVSTGEKVIRDILYDGHPEEEPGAIVTRVAESFLRFGSFEIHASRNDVQTMKELLTYVLTQHFGKEDFTLEGCLEWLQDIGSQTAFLVSEWMRVGFVHGVMNTDNMSIHSVTIDYGPYGWVEPYQLDWTPNTTDKYSRRYTYGNQPMIAMWNYARLLDAILPCLELQQKKKDLLEHFQRSFQEAHHRMWCNKLGFTDVDERSIPIIEACQELLQESAVDMTMFFRELSHLEQPSIEFLSKVQYGQLQSEERWKKWIDDWFEATNNAPNRDLMFSSNPKYVLRNWLAYNAIEMAEKGDMTLANELYTCLQHPYDEQKEFEKFYRKRPEWAENKPGCSMLSCSS